MDQTLQVHVIIFVIVYILQNMLIHIHTPDHMR